MKKEFSLGFVEFIQPNIMKVVYEKDAPITFEIIMEIAAIRKTLNIPIPYKALAVYNQSMANFDESFKLFLAQNEDAAVLRIADANVISSSLKIEAAHYQNFYKPVVPTKFFTDEKEAVVWLEEQ